MTSVNEECTADPRHIGHLLWAALRRARRDGMDLLASDPEATESLTPSHARLLDHLPPDGARVTDLAARLRITKQALGQLAGQLTDRGIVEIVADPNDGRARLIRCTARGERAQAAIHTTTQKLEDRWRAEVGDARYAVFREVLVALAEAGPQK